MILFCLPQIKIGQVYLILTMLSSISLLVFGFTVSPVHVQCYQSRNLPSNWQRTFSLSMAKDSKLFEYNDETKSSRRQAIKDTIKFVSLVSGTYSLPAIAFPNKISDRYDDRPKRKGPQPKDLGLSKRKDMVGEEYIGLKNCGAAPNCFCSTDSEEDDPSHSIKPWTWPASFGDDNVNEAFEQLCGVIRTYKPGQSNIDGGGFQIVNCDTSKGYIYVQFESLKNGFIDDFELAYLGDNGGIRQVQVRSSSRIGYLDYGVNAKRINYIAEALRESGWDAPGVDLKGQHRSYADENGISA